MSARLIKNAEGAAPSAYLPYALPEAAIMPETGSSPAPAAFHAGAPQPAPVDDTSAPAEARAILEAAHAQAEMIIAEARGRAASIEREAREQGEARARAIAAEEVAQAVAPLREQLSQTINEVEGLRAAITRRAESDLVRLAIEIAKKIVHREVTTDREIALTLARVALARLHSRAAAALHLHPDDYAYVAARRERLEASGAIDLIEDRSIGRGGCLIRTDMGDVDARIEQQFAEIERGFLGL
jgi:flagellar assembly protein FliH